MKYLIVAMLIGLLTGIGYSAPLGTEVEVTSRFGDLPVPGSIAQDCQYLNELLVKRPFDLNGLTVTPFIDGKVYNATFCDDMIMKSLTIGCEVDVNDSIIVGVDRTILDWGKGIEEETRSSSYVKVTF